MPVRILNRLGGTASIPERAWTFRSATGRKRTVDETWKADVQSGSVRRMKVEPKIVLELPLSDEALLPAFVKKCLARNASLIAVVGDGCQRVEDEIDELIVGNGSDDRRFITTTSHPGETLDQVVEFATVWWINADGPTEVVRI